MIRDQELVIQVKSGEKRIVLFSGSLILGRSARPIGLTCVVHDITERKNMEERLVKAERLASIGELAGQLGHDLRNPLAGMKNSIYLLRKRVGNLQISKEQNSSIYWIELLRILIVLLQVLLTTQANCGCTMKNAPLETLLAGQLVKWRFQTKFR